MAPVLSTAATEPPVTAQESRTGERPGRPAGLSFEVSDPLGWIQDPIPARVYVMLAPADSSVEPRFGPNWFRPQPFLARDAQPWEPGRPVVLDSSAACFPGPLETLEPGDYAIQAVVRVNPDTHRIGTGEGNLFGPVVKARLDGREPTTIALRVDQRVPPRTFRETARVKLAEFPSSLLSEFHGRPIRHRAAVILPEGADDRRRPALYIIPGFGGDHHLAGTFLTASRLAYAQDLVRVILDPDCGTGHHVFADSATNGPRGKALIEEFIPYLERTFPIRSDPRARLLNGHSSGGWSSLWLQITYPDFFGGTWSTSPDPVDFRDFQRVNIYDPRENMFRDAEGRRRPLARMGTLPVLFYDSFSRMEEVMGWGGQLGSFEAVFSPRDDHGAPRKLWDRTTGAIDPEVARAWERYDIRLVLERRWAELGPKLAGKIHVVMGDTDTFYLEGATRLLKESLERLGSDAQIEIVAGRDHSSILDDQLAARLDREMHAAVAAVDDGE